MNVPLNVLCVTEYFVPGFLGGGPITTLVNMRKQLTGSVVLSIFTRDRDHGSGTRYPGIKANLWTVAPDGPIFYACPGTFGSRGVKQALAAENFDVVYFNSYFSRHASILPYLSIRRTATRPPILIAPRGEFSPGALRFKKLKKRIFLKFAKLLGLYSDVFWHASTEMEAEDILRLFPYAADRVYIAADPVLAAAAEPTSVEEIKEAGRLRIAFISRISPKKNLDGLLRMLAMLPAAIDLDIFGPVEDSAYWRLCQGIIAGLPANIHVRTFGAVSPELVSNTFSNYHLFAFPTHGENFGHVIFEALRGGTPVVISDQTPWRADESGAVVVIPLENANEWSNAILKACNLTADQQKQLRIAAFRYAQHYADGAASVRQNLDMFESVVSR